jgi:hypothetical protein
MKCLILMVLLFMFTGCFLSHVTTTEDSISNHELGCDYSIKLVGTTYYGVYATWKIIAPNNS